MKKFTLCKPLIVVLSLLMVFHSTAYALSAGEPPLTASVSWEDKIDPVLLTKMQETTDEKLPVWLWMEDIDQNKVEATVYKRTGLREAELSVIDEPIDNELAASIAAMGKADAGTAAETRAEFQSYLERTEAARALENQRVDIYLEELRAVQKEMHREKNAVPDAGQVVVYTYTAEDALRILQASVGLIMGHFNRDFDVNGDGYINATDALLALQSSVGLIVISWPADMVFPE